MVQHVGHNICLGGSCALFGVGMETGSLTEEQHIGNIMLITVLKIL